MPINTPLNIDPYFDDYDISKKYYRVLFKPRFAVQSRELTQLQTILQNQIEQFGDNIYKEGSIIKGCNFTELADLKYIKVNDDITAIDGYEGIPSAFLPRTTVDEVTGVAYDYAYELEGSDGLIASIISASNGFQSRSPDLNTFFINYVNTSDTNQKIFYIGETISVRELVTTIEEVNGVSVETKSDNGIVATTKIANFSNPVGNSFGISVSEGIIFQKGHFLYSDAQTTIISKYIDTSSEIIQPNSLSIGYIVDETIVNSQQDTTLLDSANGSPNVNAPGADRLQLSPRLVSLQTSLAEADASFFALRRYENGSAVQIRDVSQFNSISDEMAKRAYETSGDYITNPFDLNTKRRSTGIVASVGSGVIYSKGYRVENKAERSFPVDEIAITETETQNNQPITFEYGGYCDVVAATGLVNIENFSIIKLLDASETEIGNAVVKNYNGSKLYIFAIRMLNGSNFASVKFAKQGIGNTGLIEITPRLRNSADSSLIFDTGMFSIKTIDDFTFNIRRQKSNIAIDGSGDAIVSPDPSETFNAYTLKNILVVNTNFENVTINSSSITEQGNLALELDDVNSTATVYYNAQITPDSAKVKQKFDFYVKVYHRNSTNKISLGLPDTFELLSVTGEDGVEYGDSFRLAENQKDNFYDHSYITFINGRKKPENNELLIVKVSGFRVDFSDDYNFFTVNSYPNIPMETVPYFESSNGKIMDMRSCIDFRPYRLAIAQYATNVGGATILPANTPIDLPDYSSQIFDTSINYAVPESFTSGSADIEYFLNRTDVIVADSYGSFSLIKGTAGTTIAPSVDSERTIIAEIFVPGFPALTPEEASKRGKMRYGVKIKPIGIDNYTMKEINDLAKTVSRLTYYSSVSSLESSAQNVLIQDSNGLNRFKNGIMVDPFNDLSIANVKDPEFSASVDFSEKSLAPAIKTIPFNLIFNSDDSDSVQVFKDKIITLAPNLATNSPDARVVSQPYASNFRNCVSNFYSYDGVGFLEPEYDAAYDVNTDAVQIDIDLVEPFMDLVEGINEFVPLTSTTSVMNMSTMTTERTTGNRPSTTNVTTDSFQDTSRKLQVLETTNMKDIGDFVTNIQFQPYMRSREVQISMFGLRPNTAHYFFFDEQDVNEFVAPATLSSSNVISRNGKLGDAVKANANGELFAIFILPADTFFVGDRIMTIADVDQFNSISSGATSKGNITYRAYNFSIDKTSLTMSTRMPEIDIEETTTTRTVTTRSVPIVPARDPLAQTFFIKSSMTSGNECIHAASVDLYFKRKGTKNGVSVMIREVVNGYPSKEILPFSKIHLKSSQVAISEDASIPTNVVFEAPIRLDSEKEYCIVVMPDAADPDYLIFTSKVGGEDYISGLNVVQDWGDGVLFTSTNDRAWQSYQDEDIKFTLYRYNFNVSTGTAVFETENAEFLGLIDTIGKFRQTEKVYSIKGNTSYNIGLTVGSDTGTGTGLNGFSAGDYLLVDFNDDKNLMKVVSSNSSSVVFENVSTVTGTVTTRPVVVGSVTYFNKREPDTLILENSSARVDVKFSVDDIIFGIDSGARAKVTALNSFELSYIQPMLNKVSDTRTNVSLSGSFIDPANPSNTPFTKPINFGENVRFNAKAAILQSHSSFDLPYKSAKIIATLSNNGFKTNTPVMDLGTGMMFAYQYKIGNDSETSAKYVSKKVQLSEGFVAEDFNLYASAYRPVGTDIKAYIRLVNEADPSNIVDNAWIELEMVGGAETFTSSSNINDFREYAFEIPSSAKDSNGVVEYTNTYGEFSGYRTFDIKIEMLADNKNIVPRLLDFRGIAFE